MTLLRIVQVNVGLPAYLGDYQGKPVDSSIRKEAVPGDMVNVGLEGIDGDRQEDTRMYEGRRIHGGPLKAVYAFPISHLAWYGHRLGTQYLPGVHFGENLSIVGADEREVRIGDEYALGPVLLRVTGPRRPCRKLAMHLSPKVVQFMMQTAHTGWYFQVLRPGLIPTDGPGAVLELTKRDTANPTVAEAFTQKVRPDSAMPDPSYRNS